MSKEKELLPTKVLESPAGQDALETLAKTYASTGGDTRKAIASAIDRAKQLGNMGTFRSISDYRGLYQTWTYTKYLKVSQ